MIKTKTYTGLVLDDDNIKIATINVAGSKVTIQKLDQVKLVSSIETKEKKNKGEEDVFADIDDDLGDDSIFGLEDDDSDDIDEINFDDLEDDDAIDFDELDSLEEEDEGFGDMDIDMVDETEDARSNEVLLYNVLASIDAKRIDLGLNIPAGNAIFQILKDSDFSETKKKDLEAIVTDRLEDMHGISKTEDQYSYTVRNDGALLLSSIDEEPALLRLINKSLDLYRGKLTIHEIQPDEILLLGLIRSNYEFDENSITAVVQFGDAKSRVIFLRGTQIWLVSPIISEGLQSKKFLNTIFSKILFQLDTGEVPNLDRIILCNNSLGETAVEFFSDRFQDVDITEFNFSDDTVDHEHLDPSTIASFTTAIAAAWSAAGINKKEFPDISFLPEYVRDRQKIFKLQWHGVLLLLLIFFSPIVFNYFYTNNVQQISSLNNEIQNLDAQIQTLEPIVQDYNRINAELEQIQGKLVLLDTLAKGTLRWSTDLHVINSGVQDIGGVWFTRLNRSDEGDLELEGLTLRRNRIPLVADIFEGATLIDVSSEEIRENVIFTFRYVIDEVVDDRSAYSPQGMNDIQQILGN